MLKKCFLLLLTLVALALGCSSSATEEETSQDLNAGKLARAFFVTAKSVLEADLKEVSPAVRPTTALEMMTLRQGDAIMGDPGGVLSSWSGLGALGAIGDNSWNPSRLIGGLGEWNKWFPSGMRVGEVQVMESGQTTVRLSGGVFTENGPLSAKSIIGDENYKQVLSDYRAGGLLSGVGPDSALGPRAALGPLGPVGGHGFEVDEFGRYLHNGKVVRTVTVPYDPKTWRTHGLFEDYPASFAKALKDNDTSFMVHGDLGSSERSVSFPFASHETQFVTVTVVPINQLDTFTLTLRNAAGKVVAISDSRTNVNWIQIAVPQGMKLSAEVTLDRAGFHPFTPNSYRLYVVGSTKHVSTTEITGPHQIEYSPN